jgi:hypothetical protein
VDPRLLKLLGEMLGLEKYVENLKKINEKFEKLKSEIESDEEKNFKKLAKGYKAQIEEEERIEQVEEKFQLFNFIKSKKNCAKFRIQLEREYCDENLTFIERVQEFKESTDPKTKTEIASEILKDYVEMNSKKELNVPNLIKSILSIEMKELKEGDSSIPEDFFDGLVNDILTGTLSLISSF